MKPANFSRLVLVLAALLLARIGSRYIIDPVAALAPAGIVLGSVKAVTLARVGLGAFPLAIAIFALLLAALARSLRTGVALIAIVMATALCVRLGAIVANGGLHENLGPLTGESVFLLLSLLALVRFPSPLAGKVSADSSAVARSAKAEARSAKADG